MITEQTNPKTLNNKMFLFLKEYCSNILAVDEIYIKDNNDEWGDAQEHFIVKLRLCAQSCKAEDDIQKTCLVSVKQFKSYWEKKEDVIFIKNDYFNLINTK
jgi:hypothetical protein